MIVDKNQRNDRVATIPASPPNNLKKTDKEALATSAFRNAEKFLNASRTIHIGMEPKCSWLPFVVNCAFACELYLKSLLSYNKIKFNLKKGHNLHYLFGLLPENIKDDLTAEAINLSPNECLDKLLIGISDIFVSARYSHEKCLFSFNILGLEELTLLIRKKAYIEIRSLLEKTEMQNI